MDNLNPRQFQPELEGIKWNDYAGEHESAWEKELRQRKEHFEQTGATPEEEPVEHWDDTEKPVRNGHYATANVRLAGLSSDRMFYNDEQKQTETSGIQRLQNIANKRPLPRGYTFNHSSEQLSDGSNLHRIEARQGYASMGTISWNGDTGKVNWMGVDRPELRRLLTPHLVLAAHQVVHGTEEAGPTHSNDLSPYSYRTAKRLAAAFIPEDAHVGVTPIADYEKRLEQKRNPQAIIPS